jgi:hypothetical protein
MGGNIITLCRKSSPCERHQEQSPWEKFEDRESTSIDTRMEAIPDEKPSSLKQKWLLKSGSV